jgi:hypothetical protein
MAVRKPNSAPLPPAHRTYYEVAREAYWEGAGNTYLNEFQFEPICDMGFLTWQGV